MPHGNADRLLPQEQTDTDRLDAAMSASGAGEDGERLGIVNDLLGPRAFGKLFGNLAPFRPPDDGLIALGTSGSTTGGAPTNMEEVLPSSANTVIPAGFTYLGQFVDHDLTLDPTVGFPFIQDDRKLRDARTPAFDLDSVYGFGPKLQPELYDSGFPADRARLAIGSTNPTPSIAGRGNLPTIPGSLPNDLPRRADLSAIVGDHRNDENLIIAQLHVAFLKFHNRVIGTLPDDDGAFEEARRLVTWHYQWIVLNDLLPRIVDPAVRQDVLTNGRRFFQFEDAHSFMPVEFSTAAYRLGHSMVREQYNYNRVFNAVVPTALVPATLDLLFDFTGAGELQPTSTPDPHAVLSGIPSNWIIDWRRFFEVTPDSVPGKLLNVTRGIDTSITHFLFNLRVPGVVAALPSSLPERNLLRGSRLGLPTGQDVARAMGIATLTADEVATGATGGTVRKFGFDTATPLWFYILKEAELRAGGQHLGPVGSRIVSEVFVGLLDGDENSFRHRQPTWTPTLPAHTPGTFTMADLLLFVNDLNPIGPDPSGK
jgi:heme peroxidase